MHRPLVLFALALGGCGGVLGSEVVATTVPLAPADAIVVLGNRPPRTPDGRVAPETARRVRAGADLFARSLASVFVVTGGPAPGGGTEADVMAEYARTLGVPESAIVREDRARDTAENAGYAAALACAGRVPCRVIVVSSPYHLRRAAQLFRCAGADVQIGGTPIPDDALYQLSFTFYEYAVRVSYVFDDACGRARRLASDHSGPSAPTSARRR